jgi:hypothetical protein
MLLTLPTLDDNPRVSQRVEDIEGMHPVRAALRN